MYMEEIGAPSIYQLTQFIYFNNNPYDRDSINNNNNIDNNSTISSSFNEENT